MWKSIVSVDNAAITLRGRGYIGSKRVGRPAFAKTDSTIIHKDVCGISIVGANEIQNEKQYLDDHCAKDVRVDADTVGTLSGIESDNNPYKDGCRSVFGANMYFNMPWNTCLRTSAHYPFSMLTWIPSSVCGFTRMNSTNVTGMSTSNNRLGVMFIQNNSNIRHWIANPHRSFMHGTEPIHQRNRSSIGFNFNGRCFGSLKDGNPGRYGYGKDTGVAHVKKGWTKTKSIVNISFRLIRWAVVMPFRFGKWTLNVVSWLFKAIGHIVSVCGRAVVVARVGGVSGIVKSIVDGIKHTIHWCKTGFRLYFANVKVSYYILLKRLKGHPMKYNERKLLMNTLNDALKLVPFSFFLIVPFAELLLPVAIRLFPQMLPSTFRTDNSKSDDYLQKKLLAKKELAQFFQELVQERTNQLLQDELDSSLKTKMEALKDFQERILNKNDKDVNPFLSSNELLVFAKIFKKEFKLDQMNLETLKVMCKLLGITPFSMRSHVVLQLRHHLLKIQREDRLIMWEGVDSLTTEELQEACRDRAMKFYNISKDQLKQQLQQWLDLSSMPEISPILLLWSRCITMTHEPMAIEADDETAAQDGTFVQPGVDDKDAASAAYECTKVGEKFAEEVTTAQKACSTGMMKAMTDAAEVDAQKLVYNEERLAELSQKAKELKDIIKGNVKPPSEEEITVDSELDDIRSIEMMEKEDAEDLVLNFEHDDHVIRHTKEISQMAPLSKKEILMRHEELLSALHLQSQISDLQHSQLTEMFTFLLKLSEDPKSMAEEEFAQSVDELVASTRSEMEKIEELTSQFDRHKLSDEETPHTSKES